MNKLIALLLLTMSLLCGCDYVTPLVVQNYEISSLHKTPVLGEPFTLTILITQPQINYGRPRVYLQTEGDNFQVLSRKSYPSTDEDTYYVFELLPQSPGTQTLVVNYGTTKLKTKTIDVAVKMSDFFNKEGSNFAEMINAPDEYIYGAHITLWEGDPQSIFVTGHAASNVCRKISGTLFNYALARSEMNDDFFMVAGLASLPKSSNKLDIFKSNINSLKDLKKISAKLNNFIALSALKNNEREVNHTDKIDSFLEDATLSQAIRRELIELRGGISKDETELGVTSKWRYWLILRRLKEEITKDLKSLAKIYSQDTLYSDEEKLSIITFNDFYSTISKDSQFDDQFRSYLADPKLTLDYINKGSNLRLYPLLVEFSQQDKNVKQTIKDRLREIVLFIESDELFTSGVKTAKNDLGLVKEKCNRYSAYKDDVRSGIKHWASDGETGEAKIASITDDELGKARSNCGFRKYRAPTIVMMPYYELGSGDELVFTISDEQLYGDDRTQVQELLNTSISQEMRRDLEQAANRLNESYHISIVKLANIQQGIVSKDDASLRRWFKITKEYRFTNIDGQGKNVGTSTKILSNFEYWQNRLNFALYAKGRAETYQAMLEQADKASKSPYLISMIESTLVDSFLRGWDLSFMDNSKSSPYGKWLDNRRDNVWGLVYAQAQEKGIDITEVISEATVFQVRRRGDDLLIKPVFVANIGETIAIKSPATNLVYYENQWNDREPIYLNAQSYLAESDMNKMNSQYQADHKKTATTVAGKVYSVKEWLASGKGKLDIGKVRTSLQVAPESTAKSVIQNLWSLWNGSEISSEDLKKFVKAKSVKKNNFSKVLVAGSWPFADTYLSNYIRLQVKRKKLKDTIARLSKVVSSDALSEANKQKAKRKIEFQEDELKRLDSFLERMLGTAKKIDPEFSAKVLNMGQIEFKSELYQRYNTWITVNAFDDVTEVLSCLVEALTYIDEETDTAIDEETDTAANVKSKVKKCQSQLNDIEERQELKYLLSKSDIDELKLRYEDIEKSQWDFNTLGKIIAKAEITEYLQLIAEKLVSNVRYDYKRNPSKELLSSMVKFVWYTGQYNRALQIAIKEIKMNSQNPKAKEYVNMVGRLKGDLLKALIYSGGKIDISLFGRKASDWIIYPENINQIIVGYKESSKAVARSNRSLKTRFNSTMASNDPHFLADIKETNSPIVLVSNSDKPGMGLQVALREGNDVKFVGLPIAEIGKVDEAVYISKSIKSSELDGLLYDQNFELIQQQTLVNAVSDTVLVRSANNLYVIQDSSFKTYQGKGGKIGPLASLQSDAIKIKYLPRLSPMERVLKSTKMSRQDILSLEKQLRIGEIDIQNTSDSLLTYLPKDNGGLLLFRQNKGVALIEVKDNKLVQIYRGSRAYSKLDVVDQSIIAKAMSRDSAFIHVDSFTTESSNITMHVGVSRFDIPRVEMDALLIGEGATPAIDSMINQVEAEGIEDVIIYRSAMDRSRGTTPVSAGGSGGDKPPPGYYKVANFDDDGSRKSGGDKDNGRNHTGGRQFIHATSLVVALSKRSRRISWYLDDETDLAKHNIATLPRVASASDIGAYVSSESSYAVNDYGAIKNIEKILKKAEIEVGYGFARLDAGNLLMISGHHDQALVDYLQKHSKAGNFKDKLVMLFSCYDKGSENLNHQLVRQGGAKGVLFFNKKINPQTVQEVVVELSQGLKKLDPNNPALIEDLLDQSIDKAIKKIRGSKETKEKIKVELQKLKQHVIQVSSVTTLTLQVA